MIVYDGDDDTHALTLHEWAIKYRGSAILGGLALLLIVGRGLHARISVSRFADHCVGVPHCLLGGALGFLAVILLRWVGLGAVVADVRGGLHDMGLNMVNYTFTAVMLGFAATTSLGRMEHKGADGREHDYLESWRMIASVVTHEGTPMLVFSQVLLWGNSCVTLVLSVVWQFVYAVRHPDGHTFSPYAGPIINMGLEAGRDVLPNQVRGNPAAEATVHLADNLGLVLALVVAVLLLSRLAHQSIMSRRIGTLSQQATHSARISSSIVEHFRRGAAVATTGPASGEVRSGATSNHHDQELAGLGWHLGLVAVSVFAAYMTMLLLKALESLSSFLHHHAIFSTMRLFKLSMLMGLVILRSVSVHQLTGVSAEALSGMTKRATQPLARVCNAEWFHRLSGITLDLIAISSVAALEWARPINSVKASHVAAQANGGGEVYDLAYIITSALCCVGWNVWALHKLSPTMFPNFHLARAAVLIGDSLGHSWVGLLVARAYDPLLETPVPLAYACKLLLSLPVPGSSGKNQLVTSSIQYTGTFATLIMCIFILLCWWFVHVRFLKPWWPKAHAELSVDDDEYPLLRPHAGAEDGAGPSNFGDARDLTGQRGEASGNPRHDSASTVGLPTMTHTSQILSREMVRVLAGSLPPAAADRHWHLAYSLTRDGASLQTLLSRCSAQANHILVIKDSWGYCFGAFLAHGVTVNYGSARYYGSGESFLFSFHNGRPQDLAIYTWTQANDLFTLSSPSVLAIGGGGGFGLHLDDELDNGVSNPCATYGNRRLSSTEFFKVLSIEVYRLDSAYAGSISTNTNASASSGQGGQHNHGEPQESKAAAVGHSLLEFDDDDA